MPLRLDHVAHRIVVSTAKTLAIILRIAAMNVRIPVLLVPFGFRFAMMVEIVDRRFYAGMKSALLHLLELRWRLVPWHGDLRLQAGRHGLERCIRGCSAKRWPNGGAK